MNIDICESQREFNRNTTAATNNVTICDLINPRPISNIIESVEYSGEIITAIKVIPHGIEEEKIMVQTVAQKFVSDIEKQAIKNVTSLQTKLIPMCTNISIICKTIIKSGVRKGDICGRPATINYEFCGYHKPKPKTNKIIPVDTNNNVTNNTDTARSFVSRLLDKFTKTKKNKVVPMGGKKRRKKRKQLTRKKAQ